MAEEQKKDSGLTNAAASKAGAEIGKRVGQKIATQVASKVAGAAAAGVTGGLSLIASEVGSRVATFINKHKGAVAKGATAAVAAPFILGATVVGAIGAGLAALGSAIIISVIAIPLTVAFFLLIINNSAYMVPPSSTTTSSGEVIISDGTIPEGCFVFEGWPEDERIEETKALLEIAKAGNYMVDLCAGGKIRIIYSTVDTGYGGFHLGNRRVEIYPDGRGSIGNRLHTLAHELGHVYGAAYNSILIKYRDDPKIKLEHPICSYSYTYYYFEGFAESLSLFIVQSPATPNKSFACFPGGTNLKTKYPNNWNFMDTNIFKGDFRW